MKAELSPVQLDYPGSGWESVNDAAALGWAPDRLAQAGAHARSIGTAALMIVQNGRVVLQEGEVETRFNVHSIRKSLLSALIGIEVAAGCIDLAATLEELDSRWDITQLQASRSRPILDMHRLAAENPVWVVCATRGQNDD